MANKIRNERLEIKLTEEEKAFFEICNALNMNGILETISGYAIQEEIIMPLTHTSNTPTLHTSYFCENEHLSVHIPCQKTSDHSSAHSYEEYVSYQRDMDCFDELLSASAYVSNRCKYEMKKANTKEEIEDAFRNSKILFVDDSYDAGKAVLYFAIDIDNKRAFRFASRYVFVNWFRYIPITFTDRNHYKSIIDKEPLFANVPALIDFQ